MQILCATDFSKSATDAADVAAALAKKMKLPLRLVHCGQDFIVMGDLPVVVADERPVKDQLRREAERLRRLTCAARQAAARVRTRCAPRCRCCPWGPARRP